MEDVGVERVFARPIKLFELSDWAWDQTWVPGGAAFTLVVAGQASPDDEIVIRRFAREAIAAGCGYVCAWGAECELVHDLFDVEAMAVNRFVMSTWHDDEALPKMLYYALVNAIPEEISDSPVILAVEKPWIADVRRLVADQEELARLWVADD